MCEECAGYGRFWIKNQQIDGRGKVRSESIAREIKCTICDGSGRPVNNLLYEEPDFIASADRKPESEEQIQKEAVALVVEATTESESDEMELSV